MYCCKPDIIIKRHFSLANVWFYEAERVCSECYVVHFENEKSEEVQQNGENCTKIVIWGGSWSVLWLQIRFSGLAVASPGFIQKGKNKIP